MRDVYSNTESNTKNIRPYYGRIPGPLGLLEKNSGTTRSRRRPWCPPVRRRCHVSSPSATADTRRHPPGVTTPPGNMSDIPNAPTARRPHPSRLKFRVKYIRVRLVTRIRECGQRTYPPVFFMSMTDRGRRSWNL